MFWVAICFLLVIIWLVKSAAVGVSNAVRNYNPTGLNPEEERSRFVNAVRDKNCEVEDKIKQTMRVSDLWLFLGREPTEAEEVVLKDYHILYYLNDLLFNGLMSKEGKLYGAFYMDRDFPIKDKAARALVEEIYLKIEDYLNYRGVPTVVTIRQHISYSTENLLSLRDMVQQNGYGCTKYGDKFGFANTTFADSGRAMSLLRRKVGYR